MSLPLDEIDVFFTEVLMMQAMALGDTLGCGPCFHPQCSRETAGGASCCAACEADHRAGALPPRDGIPTGHDHHEAACTPRPRLLTPTRAAGR